MLRLGLRPKLLGVTLGLLAALTAGALFMVRHYFGEQLREQSQRELTAGAQALSSVLERTRDQLLDRGRLLTELPSLQLAMSQDPKQLEPLLLEVKAIRAANLLWATDPQGIVLASTGEYPPVGENLAERPLVKAALNDQVAFGFDRFGEEWWLILCLPAKRADTPGMHGTVTLALLVGEAYLVRLSELIGCQIGFLWGENRLWSKGWPENIRHRIASVASLALSKPPQNLSLSREHFLWLARPMTVGLPQADGSVALLGIRIDESVIQQTTRAIGWIALLTMGIGTLLLFWAIRSITKPVKILVQDSHRIRAGDLTHRSHVRGVDEIAELATSFNQMVERLQISYGQLTELNRTLEQRVEERTKQLEQAQAQLLQAEKLASIGQLAAGVAHELNNPLMVIMGNSQLALRMLTSPHQKPESFILEIKELLQAIDQQSHHSKLIVNNLLDFARVKPPTRVASDVHALLDESMTLVGHQASLQSVEIVREYGQGLPKVQVDPGQMKQVFVNIILNAVQAMPLGGRLTLKTSIVDSFIEIVVQDTGIGIAPDAIKKVFDPFFTTKPVGVGTGLGLSLSYSIVQRHEGSISLISQPNQGTTVTLRLPSSGKGGVLGGMGNSPQRHR